MKHSQWFAGLILFSLLGHLPSTWAALNLEGGWEKVNESEGIQVFVRDVPGTSLVAVRGEADVDAPPEKVLHVIMDCSRAQEWVENLKNCQFVRQVSDAEMVSKNHFKTPIVMKDRDFVASAKVSADLKEQSIEALFISTEDPGAPLTSAIRGEIIESRYRVVSLEGGKRSHMIGTALVDPKGSVPKWIVNFFQKQWPLRTIKSLRKQVARTDIQVSPFFQNLLRKVAVKAPETGQPK